jgi:hypothetical protein
MNLADNIKNIREEKSLKQIEVANHIGIDKSAYSKIDMTTDQVINYDGKVPKEVIIEDKTAVEQMRLIQQLDEEDKQMVFKIIDKMLTTKKFKDFFQKNVAML